MTRMGPLLTRRGFVSLAALGASALVVRSRPWTAIVAFAPVSLAERLAGLMVHRESARVVGSAYLDRVPSESSAGRLVERISAGLPEGRRTLLAASDAELRALLSEAIRSDFEADRVVDVDGWILSPTEARLYALTASV